MHNYGGHICYVWMYGANVIVSARTTKLQCTLHALKNTKLIMEDLLGLARVPMCILTFLCAVFLLRQMYYRESVDKSVSFHETIATLQEEISDTEMNSTSWGDAPAMEVTGGKSEAVDMSVL